MERQPAADPPIAPARSERNLNWTTQRQSVGSYTFAWDYLFRTVTPILEFNEGLRFLRPTRGQHSAGLIEPNHSQTRSFKTAFFTTLSSSPTIFAVTLSEFSGSPRLLRLAQPMARNVPAFQDLPVFRLCVFAPLREASSPRSSLAKTPRRQGVPFAAKRSITTWGGVSGPK